MQEHWGLWEQWEINMPGLLDDLTTIWPVEVLTPKVDADVLPGTVI